MIDSETQISRRPDLVAVDMQGSTVMMDVRSGKYYRLTEVGGDIWAMLEQPATLGRIIEKLCAEYAVEPEVCRQQTTAFVQNLADRGLLVLG